MSWGTFDGCMRMYCLWWNWRRPLHVSMMKQTTREKREWQYHQSLDQCDSWDWPTFLPSFLLRSRWGIVRNSSYWKETLPSYIPINDIPSVSMSFTSQQTKEKETHIDWCNLLSWYSTNEPCKFDDGLCNSFKRRIVREKFVIDGCFLVRPNIPELGWLGEIWHAPAYSTTWIKWQQKHDN